MFRSLTSVAFALVIATMAQASTQYLRDLLRKPSYRASWNTLLKGQRVEPWLADYSRTYDGPASPNKVIRVGKIAYVAGSVCKTHDCGGNSFAVIFTQNGKRAWGYLIQDGEDPRFFGNPNQAQRAALKKLALE
jgi:hypothetical protein